MPGEGSFSIRDDRDSRSASRTAVPHDESTPTGSGRETDSRSASRTAVPHDESNSTGSGRETGGESAARGAFSGGTRGAEGRAAIAEDKKARSAMAPKDTITLASLEIPTTKPTDQSAESPNRFKELFDTDHPSFYRISKGPDGKEELKPIPPLKAGEKLGPGDYIVSFHRKDGLGADGKDGKPDDDSKDVRSDTDRLLRLHIPKSDAPMSLILAIHGVMPLGKKPDKFTETVDLATQADNPKEDPFMVAWAQAAENSIKGNKSHFWIEDNTPVRPEHVDENAKRLGYKDGDFIAALPEWIKKNTNYDGKSLDSIAGHSQGSVLSNGVVRDSRLAGVFPNAFLINGTMMTDKDGKVIAGPVPPGNAVNTVIFFPNDKIFLPEKTEVAGIAINKTLQAGKKLLSSFGNAAGKPIGPDGGNGFNANLQALANAATSKSDPALEMDNINQDPLGQVQHYLSLLGSNVQRYLQLAKPDAKPELKTPTDFGPPKETAANFDPRAHANANGPIPHIWSAKSLTNGKSLTVVRSPGSHMPDGDAPGSCRYIHTAATIAYYHRLFNQQRRAQANTNIASDDLK